MTKAAIKITGLTTLDDNPLRLQNIHLTAHPGQLIVLHSTDTSASRLLDAIDGKIHPCEGSIRIHETETLNTTIPHTLGIGRSPNRYSPFDSLTVQENLILPIENNNSLGGGLSLAEIYTICPLLHAMRDMPAAQLTAGEIKILDLGRLLRSGADVLLLDHFSVGLLPLNTRALSRLLRQLKQQGYTILMAEPKQNPALHFADACIRLEDGQITAVLETNTTATQALQPASPASRTNHVQKTGSLQ